MNGHTPAKLPPAVLPSEHTGLEIPEHPLITQIMYMVHAPAQRQDRRTSHAEHGYAWRNHIRTVLLLGLAT